ncbi:MAG: hypothetical protein RLZZ59_351 [Pseudomonadota bacterium]
MNDNSNESGGCEYSVTCSGDTSSGDWGCSGSFECSGGGK